MSDSHLVLVDVQSEILSLLAHSLEHPGVHTTCARNGAEALRLLEERTRAGGAVAIVSDWVMAVLDGLGLLTCIRAQEEFRALRFVLMSGVMTDEDLVGAATHTIPTRSCSSRSRSRPFARRSTRRSPSASASMQSVPPARARLQRRYHVHTASPSNGISLYQPSRSGTRFTSTWSPYDSTLR